MARFDIFDTVETLRQQGAPFVIATVMRTADATSAKAGAKAAVTESGEIIGHLGGACVQRAVRNAATDAITKGAPQVISVKPADKIVALNDDVQTYKSGCPSGGTVDLLIEPYAHPPQLLIFGATPISQALAAHAELAGLRVCVPDGDDLSMFTLTPRDFVVVASQGNGDLAALRAAVTSPVRRVSMVASRRKADVLCAKLADAGIDASRLKSPAGLDIKGVDPHEIALSVLAEIVLWRNSDSIGVDKTGVCAQST
ncbi:MAG: xanthine dehydrogenase accessory factor [Paracoccaceae bacterium]|jgi:xanthine dehydrogenase accessory factor